MLSKRLQTVAGMVTKGNIIADIGTDHGYVPIYLVEENITDKAYAMDINQGPLDIANKHIKEKGLERKIITILSNGMEKLKDNMIDTAVIAGMGGDLIVSILENGKSIKGIKELVLSPHKRVDLVRKYLLENNWQIVDEAMVFDVGKYYTVIKALKCDKTENDYSKVQLEYGKLLLENRNPVLKEYLEKEYKKFSKIAENMKKEKSDNLHKVEEILEMNQEGRKYYDWCGNFKCCIRIWRRNHFVRNSKGFWWLLWKWHYTCSVQWKTLWIVKSFNW